MRNALTSSQANKVDELVAEEAEKEPEEIKKMYDLLCAKSLDLQEKKSERWHHYPYQCLVAARSITCDKQVSSVQVDPGQGKSAILFLTAIGILTKAKYDQVVLICPHAYLVTQMAEFLDDVFDQNPPC